MASEIKQIDGISPNEILYEFTVEDDVAYKDTWKGEMPLRKTEGKIYKYFDYDHYYSFLLSLSVAPAGKMGI